MYDTLQSTLRKGYDTVKNTGSSHLIDVRAPAAFGKDTLPGMSNVPTSVYLNDDQTRFLSRDELLSKFSSNDISLDKPITFSCGAGITACIGEVAAKIAGAEKTSIFDGSYSEYAQKGKPDFNDPDWESKYKF